MAAAAAATTATVVVVVVVGVSTFSRRISEDGVTFDPLRARARPREGAFSGGVAVEDSALAGMEGWRAEGGRGGGGVDGEMDALKALDVLPSRL